jgi:hypothetical protein
MLWVCLALVAGVAELGALFVLVTALITWSRNQRLAGGRAALPADPPVGLAFVTCRPRCRAAAARHRAHARHGPLSHPRGRHCAALRGARPAAAAAAAAALER